MLFLFNESKFFKDFRLARNESLHMKQVRDIKN